MSFLVPKQVEIANLKLRVVYYIITFIALLLAVAKFVITEQWASERLVGPHVSAELWLNPTNLTRFADAWGEKSELWFCTDPARTDYQWDPSGRWMFTNHTCMPPCDLGGASASPCIHPLDSHRRESQSQLFLVTHIEERGVGAGQDSMFFVPLEGAHTLAMAYRFAVPEPTIWGGTADRSRRLSASTGSAGNFASDVLTVIQGADRLVSRVVEPGSPEIEFELRDLLALGGLSDFLDMPNPSVGANFLPGHQRPEDGAIGRLTGLNVDLNLQCLQRPDPTVSLEGHAGQDWTGKVCYLRVERSPMKNWASVEEAETHGAGGVKRTYHGIRVAVVPGGVFKFLDLEVLILQITSSIVFLMMPKSLMFFFIVNMLGHLSVIYRNAIIERFNVGKEVACITARILSTSVTFLELEEDSTTPTQSPRPPDRDPGEEPGNGIPTKEGFISRQTMGTQMKEVLRSRKSMLQGNEMKALIDFCFQSVQDIAKLSHKQSIRDDMQEIRLMKHGVSASPPGEARGGRVNIDSFSTCCASSPSMEFDSFVKLFDMSRRTGMFERWFTPTYFAELVASHREFFDDDGMEEPSPKSIEGGTVSDGLHSGKHHASLRAKKADIVRAASQVVVNRNVAQQVSDRVDSLEQLHEQKESELQGKFNTRLDALKRELQDRLLDLQANVERTNEALQSASRASPPPATEETSAAAEAAFVDVDGMKSSVAALARRLEAVEHIALLAAEATQLPQSAPQHAMEPRQDGGAAGVGGAGNAEARAAEPVDRSQVRVSLIAEPALPQGPAPVDTMASSAFSAGVQPSTRDGVDVSLNSGSSSRGWRSPCSFGGPLLPQPR